MRPSIKQFAALLAAQIWMATGWAAAESNPVILKLQRAVQDCDEEVLRTTNSLVYRSGAAKEAIAVIVSAWNPSSNAAKCTHDRRIRALMAEALAQGHANGIVERIDLQSVRNALRDGTRSEDPETASASVFGLAAIAEPEDFRRLEALARNKVAVARMEVVPALATQCSADSIATLRRLESEFEAGYVDGVRRDTAQVRDANCKKAGRN